MSFLLDPPLLVATGAAIERVVPEEHRDRAAAVSVATFIGVSTLLYLRAPIPGLSLWYRPFGAVDGRDFMLGSGLKSFADHDAGRRTHGIAAAIFLTYPAWLALGRRLGRR